ncbi:cytochrome P450 [Marasmius fiardii PR-910]|nr:cytochrome P450 [Marasmius fiardii PR-910]
MDSLRSLVILISSLLALRFLAKQYRRRLQLPPGPKGLPILGNILELQSERNQQPWVTFSKWSRIYGDVYTFNVLGSRTIVLNSYSAINELLEQRSHNYSDRPNLPMVMDVMGCGSPFSRSALSLTIVVTEFKSIASFVVMGYSDMWRLHRKTFHQYFQPRFAPEYYDLQRERTTELMQKLGKVSEDFTDRLRTHFGGIILEIVYGYRVQEDNDPYVKLADNAMAGFKEVAGFGTFFVDFVPMLKYVPAWFPGATFKVKAAAWIQDCNRLRDLPWLQLKKSINEGTAVPCFCTRHLEDLGSSSSTENSVVEAVVKDCAAVAYMAGADSTVASMTTFILAMVVNPHVQMRAQKELDEVVGSSRLPDFNDRERLPYINAILLETFRWKPVSPLAVAHGSMNDDIYEGHLIPGGSIIIPNTWAVLYDESLYGPNTETFNPDRFMKQDGKELPPDPEQIAFGFGRRLCPGRYVALNSLWLAMTYVLATFTIAKELDSEGKEIDPSVEQTNGSVSHPLPFKCRFIPRSSALLLK